MLPASAVKRRWVPIPSGSAMPSLRNCPVKSVNRWRVPIGVANVEIDCSFVGYVTSPTSSGVNADLSSTTRLNAASKPVSSVDVPAWLSHVQLPRRLNRAAVLGEDVVGDVEAADRGIDPREGRGDAERGGRQSGRRISRRDQRDRRRPGGARAEPV